MGTAYAENPQKKIKEILNLAAEGKSRREISEILGYKDVNGLYAYVRRHGYVWNANKGLYVVKGSKQELDETQEIEELPSKIATIISLFEKKVDGKEIASRLKFDSYQAMADYMKSKGFIWDNVMNNYIREVTKPAPKQEQQLEQAVKSTELTNNAKTINSIDKYTDILELLDKNRNRLTELLGVENSNLSLPRYALQGGSIAKTVHIVKGLDRLIKDFSDERNINQREIVKIALIDFLKKYDYSDQVKSVLHV